MKTVGAILVAALLQSPVLADTNTVFIHFGIGFSDATKRLLSAQVRFNEPIFVAGDDYLQLTGRVERSGQTITADLLGSNGQQSSFYQGPATLEKVLYAQGGGSSGGAALMWFALSTNSDGSPFVESLDAIRKRIEKETASIATTNASLSPRPPTFDPATGLPTSTGASLTIIDPTTGLPMSAPTTNILVRLTEISVSRPESGDLLTASFVPINITHPYQRQIGGGSAPKGSDTVETKIGKEFTIRFTEFTDGPQNPQQQTIHNVFRACVGSQPRELKLELVLSVPEDVPKQSDGEHDFRHWAVESIREHK